jgi:hypothetical protein
MSETGTKYYVDFLIKGETEWRRSMPLPLKDLHAQNDVFWKNRNMEATRMVAVEWRLLTQEELDLAERKAKEQA